MKESFKQTFLKWQIRWMKKILGSIGVVAIATSCLHNSETKESALKDSTKMALEEKEQLDSVEIIQIKKDSLQKIEKDSVEKLKSKPSLQEKQKQKTKVIPVHVPTYDPGDPTLDYGVYPSYPDEIIPPTGN